MMVEKAPGHSDTADAAGIEAFLRDFEQKGQMFSSYCDQYFNQQLSIADITRHLSEATADAEFFFAEHSMQMSLEQLQHYAMIQMNIDKRTGELFETEIIRSRKIICEALRNGEYFIAGLSYNSIKSSLYMLYSKQKIKTEQDQKLSELEREQEATQTLIKVLKAIDSVLLVDDLAKLDYNRIQKALEIYVTYFKQLEHSETKAAGDERVFDLFEAHVEFLRNMGFGGDPGMASVHVSLCCDTLQPLARNSRQTTLLASWRNLIDF